VAELDQREVFTDHMLWAKVRDILYRYCLNDITINTNQISKPATSIFG
jgi:hypothetical protein